MWTAGQVPLLLSVTAHTDDDEIQWSKVWCCQIHLEINPYNNYTDLYYLDLEMVTDWYYLYEFCCLQAVILELFASSWKPT